MSEQESIKAEVVAIPSSLEHRQEEFYIGWQSQAPASITLHIKRVLVLLFVIIIVIGLLLAASQKKFSTANFEFGSLTEVTGFYFNKPVPSIKAEHGTDRFGNKTYVTIPLVGFGKFGAEGVMDLLEKEQETSLDQRELTLKGTLLYNDGKLLMQIDAKDKPLISVGKMAEITSIPVQKEIGTIILRGEIVDPKCFFGVMKPGEGKVHKDCAIRCILGGIPPVLRVQNEEGQANYYLLVGPQGEKMNEAVKDLVGEPVEIKARAVQQGDWIILYTGIEKMRQISKRDLFFPHLQAVACIPKCRK